MANLVVDAARDILRDAADIIDDGWTQFAYARDAFEKSIPSTDPDAVCYCAAGAIIVAAELHAVLPSDDLLALAHQSALAALATEIDPQIARDFPCDNAPAYERAITIWNDAQRQSQIAVAAAMRAAADSI